jgi:DnaB-like helicase C terminal domain
MARDFAITTYQEQLHAYEAERSDPSWHPIRLGFGELDTAIRGVSPGQVLGDAARTSVGKTWLLQAIEHNLSAGHDAGCLSLTLEMPGPEWAERAVAIFEDVAPESVEAWARAGELLGRASRFLDRMEHVRLVEDSMSVDFLLGAWQPGRAAGLDPVEAMTLRDVLRVRVLKSRKAGDGRLVDLRFRPESRRLYEEADPGQLVDDALASLDGGENA